LSDDRPSIQYPWQPSDNGTFYAKLSQYNAARGDCLLPRAVQPRLRARVEPHARATLHAIAAQASAERSDNASAERTELELGNAVGAALGHRPRDEALLELLGLDTERAALAARALQRPDADERLNAGLPGHDDTRGAQLYRGLQAAMFTVARRAFYLGDYTAALQGLQKFAPTGDQRARHELLLAASWRRLGEPVQARRHFEAALSASRDRVAQAWLAKLARDKAAQTGLGSGPYSVR
jgi:tetratricopeptide (TPR) repeat protein